MTTNPLRTLEACGQSVWLDSISREIINSGTLRRLIDEDGISGVTANPTIFEKAIAGTHDYDQAIAQIGSRAERCSPIQIYEALAVQDVGKAADLFRPIYEKSNRHDGFVSIEVSPELASDTKGTVSEACRFWGELHRPNIMIKVPATQEGIPAIEQLIAEGINVNITLIFAVEVYEQVMEAYLSGLERHLQQGKDISHIASVASFFVSRVDTLVDKVLEDKAKGSNQVLAEQLRGLEGKAAVANAKIAYQQFERVFGSERFQKLARQGGQIQRPLWASTSTKNPRYPDTLYVDALVGKETVNTMPLQTITAVRDHGVIHCGTVTHDAVQAHQVVEELKNVGIDMKDVTAQLTVEGVQQFVDSLHKLFKVIEEKRVTIQVGDVGGQQASLGDHQQEVEETLDEMSANHFLQRLWDKDAALWKPNPDQQSEIADRLDWLHVSDVMLEHRADFTDIAQYVRDNGFTSAVVLGMGGSSLAPYVLAQSFGKQQGFPELLVLDSTDPVAVREIENRVDMARTLFLVSTKSGTTTETLSFFQTFWEKVQQVSGERAGEQFVAITDPGTKLVALAEQHSFHHCYLNPPDIGGRYSALSYFGMIPAAVAGIDVRKFLECGLTMEHACAPSVEPDKNPGARLGAVMADLARSGHNKVTFFLSREIEALGLWLEQLLAESTGKENTGLVPVPDDPPGTPADYGDDHLFVVITLEGSDDRELEARSQALESAGQPMVRLQLADLYDLAPEFFRWEFATASAGALLGINAFNQPNVQESKDNTKRLLTEYRKTGRLPEPRPEVSGDGVAVYANAQARSLLAGAPAGAPAAVQSFLSHLVAPQYLATMAYLAPSAQHDEVLSQLRVAVRDACKVAVTLGYGPRFLHSTGQLHKGGPAEGVFLQITAGVAQDLPIPGEPYSYGTLIAAQALGDFQSLEQHGRPALRLHLPDESAQSMQSLRHILQTAIPHKSAT